MLCRDGGVVERARLEIVLRATVRGFESLSLRQKKPRLNQEENGLKYIFLNGIAGVVAKRRYVPRGYANNYNVHGANGKFVKI